MLAAAAGASFDNTPDEELQGQFKTVFSSASCYSPRRNDIAHGVVDHFQTEDEYDRYGYLPHKNTFALFPSIASFKERTVKGKAVVLHDEQGAKPFF